MPHIVLKTISGRPETLKQEAAARLTQTVVDVLGVGEPASRSLFKTSRRPNGPPKCMFPTFRKRRRRSTRSPAMTRLRSNVLAGLFSAGLAGSPEAAEKAMNIRIEAGDQVIEATLEDNATARSFADLLPLKLTLTDYAATEKISDLPERLVTDGAPPGITPVVGDLTYYAPWGNLAIFIKSFRYSEGLVKLGRIRNGLEILQQTGPLEVTIQQAKGEAHELAR